jgi:4-hydroxy-tetrahydrodipicolinate synthase
MGITHVLLLPPFYFRNAPEDGIEEALASILDGVNDVRLRTTLYHIPQVSGVRVPARVAATLRHRFGPVIAGVKDSSGDFSQFEAFRDAAPELALLTGNEPDICRALARGGAGTICGVGSVAPEHIQAMFVSQAAEAPMITLCNFFEGHQFEPLLKSVLAAQSGDPSWLRVRPPLRPADAGYGQQIAEWISTSWVLPAAGAASA